MKRFRATCEVAYRDCKLEEKQIQNVLNNTSLLGIKVRLWEGVSAAKDGLEAIRRLEQLQASHDDLLAALEKFVAWNVKYPSSTIYGHSAIIRIAAELDKIAEEARAAIAKAQESK